MDRRGRIGERKIARPVRRYAPVQQFQRQLAKIAFHDLRRTVRFKAPFLRFAPQPDANALRHTPRTPAPLFGGCEGHAQSFQPVHAVGGRKTGHPHPAAVDHDLHALHRKTGLCNGGGKDHPPPVAPGKDPVLFFSGQIAIKRQNIKIILFSEGALNLQNLRFARQKHQSIARKMVHGIADRERDLLRLCGLHGAVNRPDGEHPALHMDRFCIRDQGFQGRQIEGGGHDHDPQVLPQIGAHIQRQSQPQIRMDVPFVKFVKNDQPRLRQLRIMLDHAGQDRFRHHLDPGLAGDFRFRSGAVTDFSAHRTPQQLRHPSRRCPGGDPPRLQHDDLFPCQPVRLLQQKRGRDKGTFPRPRFRRKKQHAVLPECRNDLRQFLPDRKGRQHIKTHASALLSSKTFFTSSGRISPAFPCRNRSLIPSRVKAEGSRLISMICAPFRFA